MKFYILICFLEDLNLVIRGYADKQWAIAGCTANLICPIENIASTLIWTYEPTHKIYANGDSILPEVKRKVSVVRNPSTGDHILQIRNVTKKDTGRYVCSAEYNLIVVFGEVELEVTDNIMHFPSQDNESTMTVPNSRTEQHSNITIGLSRHHTSGYSVLGSVLGVLLISGCVLLVAIIQRKCSRKQNPMNNSVILVQTRNRQRGFDLNIEHAYETVDEISVNSRDEIVEMGDSLYSLNSSQESKDSYNSCTDSTSQSDYLHPYASLLPSCTDSHEYNIPSCAISKPCYEEKVGCLINNTKEAITNTEHTEQAEHLDDNYIYENTEFTRLSNLLQENDISNTNLG